MMNWTRKTRALILITVNSVTLLLLFQNCSTAGRKVTKSSIAGVICAANPDTTVAPFSVSEMKWVALNSTEEVTTETLARSFAWIKSSGSAARITKIKSKECAEQKTYRFSFNEGPAASSRKPAGNQFHVIYYTSKMDEFSTNTKVYAKLLSASEAKSPRLILKPKDFVYLGEI